MDRCGYASTYICCAALTRRGGQPPMAVFRAPWGALPVTPLPTVFSRAPCTCLQKHSRLLAILSLLSLAGPIFQSQLLFSPALASRVQPSGLRSRWSLNDCSPIPAPPLFQPLYLPHASVSLHMLEPKAPHRLISTAQQLVIQAREPEAQGDFY